MKLLKTIVLATLVTYAAQAAPLVGTVNSIKITNSGLVEVQLKEANDNITAVRNIAADDSMRKEKLTVLLSARAMNADVEMRIEAGNIQYIKLLP